MSTILLKLTGSDFTFLRFYKNPANTPTPINIGYTPTPSLGKAFKPNEP